MIRAVVFDLDGTLVNSLGSIRHHANEWVQKMGGAALSPEEVRLFVGHGPRVLVERICESQSFPEKVEEFYEGYMGDYLQNPSACDEVYPGMESLLMDLQKMNFFLGVYSNKPHRALQEVVRRHFPSISFTQVLGFRPPAPPKPHREGSLPLIEALGLSPEEILFVGDSEVDFETAQNAGMKPLLVDWGFRSREELLPLGAPVVHEPEEIRQFAIGEKEFSSIGSAKNV